MDKWIVPHEGIVEQKEGKVKFKLGTGSGFHIMSLPITPKSVNSADISFKINLSNISPDYGFYLNVFGGKVGFCLLRNGNISFINKKFIKNISLSSIDNYTFRLELSINLLYPSISFGIIEAETLKQVFTSNLSSSFEISQFSFDKFYTYDVNFDEPITYLDIGASGGLNYLYESLYYRNYCIPIFVEPEEKAAQFLKTKYKNSRVIDYALSNRNGNGTLYITKELGCSSLAEPDTKFLSKFAIAPAFEVIRKANIEFKKFDDIFDRKNQSIDAVKIDVQGHEYEVLEGMHNSLEDIIFIELEAHLSQIYKKQKLLSDIIRLLNLKGFALCDLKPQRNFDMEYVEVNAFFVKRDEKISSKNLKNKKIFLCNLFNLSNHGGGKQLVERLIKNV